MTYVIAKGCINDASCVAVCPVDCIRPRPEDPEFMTAEQLYIDPATCIDCAACLWACPVSAIYDENDMPTALDQYRETNAEYFQRNPLKIIDITNKSRRRLPEDRPRLRVAVVGAGASGCYAAEELAQVTGVEVSVFDRLPTPYGLVRSGVAPDHQPTKGVTKLFDKTLKRANVSCFFNVDVGTDVTMAELLEHHHAVVVSAGAVSDRRLGIEGEDLAGSHSAREFVSWYNGSPAAADMEFDLSGERVVIIGNGNVALDVARVLAVDPDQLRTTDIAAHALTELEESNVREIVIAARRGAGDAAFTSSELWALSGTEGVAVTACREEVDAGEGVDLATARFGTERKLDLLSAAAQNEATPGARTVSMRFHVSPIEINGADGRVESVTFRSTLPGTDEQVEETIETPLVLRAIGYRSTALEGVPFDEERGVIPNVKGRVVTVGSEVPVDGLYCAGWAKRGPTGVIGTNKWCSAETVEAIFEDFAAGLLVDPPRIDEDVAAFVISRSPDAIDYEAWKRIDAHEIAQGQSDVTARPRVKIVSIDEMRDVAHRVNA